MTVMYHCQTFYLRTWERCMSAFASFYFVPNIALVVVYVVLELLPVPKPVPVVKVHIAGGKKDI